MYASEHGRRPGIYPSPPPWWGDYEVPRGMAVRLPRLVLLRGSKLMAEASGGPHHCSLASEWVADVADVFLSSILFHGDLWLVSPALIAGIGRVGTLVLCKDGERAAVLDEALFLLKRVRRDADPGILSRYGGRQGLVMVTKALNAGGRLLLREWLGDEALPYAPGIGPLKLVVNPEVNRAIEGPGHYSVRRDHPPALERGLLAQRSITWGDDRVLCYQEPRPTQAPAVPPPSGRAPPPAVGGGLPPRGGTTTPRGGRGSSSGHNWRGGRARYPPQGGEGGPLLRLVAPTPISPFQWKGDVPLATGQVMSAQMLHGFGASSGGAIPSSFHIAIEPAMLMALSRSYAGLANDVVAYLRQ